MESAVVPLSGLANQEVGAVGNAVLQYLTFTLADETYGVDILRVQEIRGWVPVTKVPNTPAYIQGVLNLRGTIVPVLDLRDRFHLEHRAYTNTTVVIVVSVETEGGQKVVGMVVDGVSDVLNVGQAAIQAAPDFGTSIHTDFIQGLTTVEETMVMLLDIDRMLTADEVNDLDAVQA